MIALPPPILRRDGAFSGRILRGIRVALGRTEMRIDPTATDVVIVCSNPETLDGLQAYLLGAGVRAKSLRDIEDCVRTAPASAVAFVLFPDDYRWETVLSTLASLTEKRPRVLPVLVTAHPRRFDGLVDPEHVVVVARPAWGWTIAEAIRSHAMRGRNEAV